MAMASKRNEPQTASVHDVVDLVFNSPALVVSFCNLRSKTKSEPFMLYRSLLRPLLFRLPPETAHELALNSLSFAPGFITSVLANRFKRSPFGNLRRFGLTFSNPVGLAAGFDKDGVALDSLAALGFGFIEAGTVADPAQPRHKQTRLFPLAI